MIQLTQTSYVVLGLVEQAGEATPYDLKQIVAATVGGFFSIPHSQLYAEPERLARAGYLRERREQTGRRRKHYTITAEGPRRAEGVAANADRGALRAARPGAAEARVRRRPAGAGEGSAVSARGTARGAAPPCARRSRLAGAPEEQLLVAEAGIGHSREYVRFWKKLAGR